MTQTAIITKIENQSWKDVRITMWKNISVMHIHHSWVPSINIIHTYQLPGMGYIMSISLAWICTLVMSCWYCNWSSICCCVFSYPVWYLFLYLQKFVHQSHQHFLMGWPVPCLHLLPVFVFKHYELNTIMHFE